MAETFDSPPSSAALSLYERLALSGSGAGSRDEAAAAAELRQLGLLTPSGDDVDLQSPIEVVDQMLRRKRQDLADAQAAAERLEASWRRHRESDFPLVVQRGVDSDRAYAELMNDPGSICALNRLPTGRPTVADRALDNLATGVPIRVVYDAQVMADSDALVAVDQCVAAGEQARVLPGVPWGMVVTDSAACLTLDSRGDEIPVRGFTRSPIVVAALRRAFVSWWDAAIPVSFDLPGLDAPADDRRLLTLLSAGLTDHAIARDLGVSERTVRRRITRLQAVLGGRTRFQLGVQAARRGWLVDEAAQHDGQGTSTAR